MRAERRKCDLNQKNRFIKLWLTILSMAIISGGFIARGAVKSHQVDENKNDIKVVEKVARDNEKMIGRFDERFNAVDNALERIENKIDK